MDPFEFLIGLYTIIVGIGISLLVRSVGQMLEAGSRVQHYWIHWAWIGFIFTQHVASWFVLWQYHKVEEWTLLECLLLLLVPILLYLMSHFAAPEIEEGGGESFDMRRYYYARSRWFQGLSIGAVLVSMLNDALVMHSLASTPAQIGRFAVLAVLLPGFLSRRPAVHAAQVAVFSVMIVAGSIFWGNRIG